MPAPKYPKDLSTIFEATSNSLQEDKYKEGWIMSVSKTFCGATAASMAAGGKFGPEKMNATLLDVLEEARKTNSHNPDKLEKIRQYQEMIEKKGCGEITMSELLSHRSGLIQGNTYFTANPRFKDNNLELFASDVMTFDATKKGKVLSYNNPAYMLAEDLMGLASDIGPAYVTASSTGSDSIKLADYYYAELKKRIIKPLEPLGLKYTKSIYESAAANSVSMMVQVKGVIGDGGEKPVDDAKHNPLQNTETGNVSLAAGGICSSVSDLEIYSQEISKMICGIPSALAQDPATAKEIHNFYLDAYRLGDGCISDAPLSVESNYAAPHYEPVANPTF